MIKLYFSGLVVLLSLVAIAFGQSAPAPAAPGDVAVQWEWAGRRSGRDNKLQKWGEAWREAKSDKDRAKIKVQANKYLEGQFEDDMERREKELEQIEARLDRLREQLAKRVEKKEEIIGLQLKQVTMSWEGLGWSSPEPQRGLNTFFSVPAPPTPPLGVDVTAAFPTTQHLFLQALGTRSQKLMKSMIQAAKDENTEELRELAEKVADQATEMEGVPANDLIWRIYQELGDTVDDGEFWLTLARAAEDASEGIEDDQARGNILDTAARCFFLGDDVDTAYKLQAEAVEASAEARGGEADRAIAGFHEKLKKLVEKEASGSR